MDSKDLSTIAIFYFVICCLDKCLPLPSTKTFTVESDKVCSPGKRRHIHLGKYNQSSVSVKETRYFDTWLGVHAFYCKFLVEGEPRTDDGVFAVIQNLSMRKDLNTGECIDYVQFRPKKGRVSDKVCGKISALSPYLNVPGTLSYSQESVIAPYSYIDSEGRMEVELFVANVKLEPNFKIDIDIAFTSYKACSKSDQHRSCYDDYDSKYCIWNGFFYDNIVHCPFHHCIDEGGCQKVHEDISHGTSPAIVTGAGIATLLLVFGSFLACIWLLRKLQLLCWSFPGGNGQQTPAVEFSEHGTRDPVSASPPSCDIALEPISPDKDEPPAYDTLFPPKPT